MTRLTPLLALLMLVCISVFRVKAEPGHQHDIPPQVTVKEVPTLSGTPLISRAATSPHLACIDHLHEIGRLSDELNFKEAVIDSTEFAHKADILQLEAQIVQLRSLRLC